MDKLREFRGPIGAVSLVAATVVAFVLVFVFARQILMEFIPLYAFLIALVVAGIVMAVMALPPAPWIREATPEMQRLLIVLLLVAAVILVFSLLFCWSCLTPRPRETFVDAAADPQITRLQADVTEAEEAVCKYITRADQFIKGGVGPAGKKDPSLVSAAEEKAREGVNLVLCSDDAPAAAPAPTLEDLENRIARLESTLSGFTGVVFKHSYDTTVPCQEGFAVTQPTASELEQRLAAVRQAITDQQEKYLGPIDQKTKDLQAGKVSDCDKRRGAKLSAAGGPKAAAGTPPK
jgi:hypothetical protein